MKAAVSIVRWVPITIVAFAAVSLVFLYQLDTLVNGELYSYGLYYSDEWILPYWSTIRTTMGLLYATVTVGVIVQVSAFFVKPAKKNNGTEEGGLTKEKHWNTYKLSDGSTIRIKTVLKGVKRLNTFTAEGKPLYSVKADNVVEVIDAPTQLMKTENQEN